MIKIRNKWLVGGVIAGTAAFSFALTLYVPAHMERTAAVKAAVNSGPVTSADSSPAPVASAQDEATPTPSPEGGTGTPTLTPGDSGGSGSTPVATPAPTPVPTPTVVSRWKYSCVNGQHGVETRFTEIVVNYSDGGMKAYKEDGVTPIVYGDLPCQVTGRERLQ